MIARIRIGHDIPRDHPVVVDWKLWDIPTTVRRSILTMPSNVVAVSVRLCGAAMIRAAERAARQRGIRIIWCRLNVSLV